MRALGLLTNLSFKIQDYKPNYSSCGVSASYIFRIEYLAFLGSPPEAKQQYKLF